MSQYWSQIVHSLTPYVPGEQPKVSGLIKLNTNECPYGPSPKVTEALQHCIGDQLRLYPDPTSGELVNAIANYYQVDPNQVFVGNGSDEVLAHVFQGLLKHSAPLLFPDITYSFYPVYCGLFEIDFETIPLNESFEIDIHDYQKPNGGIIFANPNAPTGCPLAIETIEALVQKNTDSVVVVDEAYIDFGGNTAVGLVNKYPNLLVIQTLSKSRSLAGLRVGFAIGNPNLIEALVRVKDSFNSYPLDRLAIAGATAAMNDRVYFEETCQRVIQSREKLAIDLQRLGFDVLPSAANFLFASHATQPAAVLAQQLREKNILVRYFNKPRIDKFLRISVGTEAECAALVTALTEILSQS